MLQADGAKQSKKKKNAWENLKGGKVTKLHSQVEKKPNANHSDECKGEAVVEIKFFSDKIFKIFKTLNY